MAIWNDKTKSASTFINKAIRGLWNWSSPTALWSDPNATWSSVNTTSWTDKLRNILTYLLTEDGGYLLQEDGGRIILTGDAWSNKTKH
jgi:hypothetical protein